MGPVRVRGMLLRARALSGGARGQNIPKNFGTTARNCVRQSFFRRESGLHHVGWWESINSPTVFGPQKASVTQSAWENAAILVHRGGAGQPVSNMNSLRHGRKVKFASQADTEQAEIGECATINEREM